MLNAKKVLPEKSPYVRAREELTAMGLIVDSGRRKFNPDTGEWDIVWILDKAALDRLNEEREQLGLDPIGDRR